MKVRPGYKQPGVGWLGGPETQVYNALTASGYSPKFVTEDEIPKCRVLVVPSTECIGASAAAKMKALVQRGGMLVTMPWVATNNPYGRPYTTQPGAGLDTVLGLQLKFPIIGQREELILSRELKDLSGGKPAKDAPVVLPLPITQRLGSEPPFMYSHGHQAVAHRDAAAKVLLEHVDGQPALTWHALGKGVAVHLNMFTFDPLDTYEVGHRHHQETFRQLLSGIVLAGGVKPPLFVERPLLYGRGILEWVQYQYRLAGGPVRVLAVFADKLAPEMVGQVALYEPIAEVYDVLDGRRVPLAVRQGGRVVEEMDPVAFTKAQKAGVSTALTFCAHLKPGQVKFYALVPYKTGPVRLQMKSRRVRAGQDPIALAVTCLAADGKPAPGPHPVHVDVFDHNDNPMPMLSRKVTVRGRTNLAIPTRLGDRGPTWTVRVSDALTGRTAMARVAVTDAPDVARLPRVDDRFYPTAKPDRIDVSDTEFLALLDALTALYRSGGQRDKGSLSFYTAERDVSRHRILQLLRQVDWTDKQELLRKHIADGHDVILLGEDIGFDPPTGLGVDPINGASFEPDTDPAAGGVIPRLPGPDILSALPGSPAKLLEMSLLCGPARVIRIGRGRLIVDPTSFDSFGSANTLFADQWARWRDRLSPPAAKP